MEDRTADRGQQAVRFTPVLVIALLVAIALRRFSPVAIIPSGHVGVLTVFGRVTGHVGGEGVHLVNPLAATRLVTIRTQPLEGERLCSIGRGVNPAATNGGA